jgi:hypothetical protein
LVINRSSGGSGNAKIAQEKRRWGVNESRIVLRVHPADDQTKKGATMPTQRIMTSAVLTLIALLAAGMFFQSPYHIWLLMVLLGAITGVSFRTGQRHVITGFALGITLTLIREAITYGPDIVRMTGLVYAAGYLFAAATTISIRSIILKLKPQQTTV